MNQTIPNTVAEFSLYAAERFLQTAVFIDDRIYERSSGTVVEPQPLQTPLRVRKAALKSAGEQLPTAVPAPLPPPEEAEYSPHDILTSFAKKGIVCALYQPKRGSSVGGNSDAYKLCSASDIVIVDWDLYGDSGTKALDLISNLIAQSLLDVPEQLRLVLIYTQESNLEQIANEVFESLTNRLSNGVEPAQDDNGLALHTPNSRVVIIGKPAKRLAKYASYEVKEKDLAERSITEFSKLAAGLLQGAILIGLAEIRNNHRKVLSKFDSVLDPAFLTHRALVLPEDGSQHVLPLLVSEIEAALEDQLPHPLLSDTLIEDWCASKWKPQTHSKSAAGAGDPKKLARDLCIKGKDGVKGNGIKDDKLYGFLHTAADSKANHAFASLMSLRTHYGKVPRPLRLGTIVKDSTGKYYLCLQPVCDAARVNAARKFLFCQLHEKTSPDANGKFNIVVFDAGSSVELLFLPKVYYVDVISFKGTSKDGTVEAAADNNRFLFKGSDGKTEFDWVAQLKPSQAQRAAASFGADLSRVGLTESEWLRSMGRK